jgi:hypothetical protein
MDATPIQSMTATEYDEGRGQYLTSHALMDYIKSPRMHQLKSAGILARKTSRSFAIGTALHTLVLEGRAEFDRGYFSPMPGTEPVNEKTGKPFGPATKAYQEWLESSANGREVLTPADCDLVNGMASAVRNHQQACYLLEQGQPEGVLRAEINGVSVQTRMDWFNPDAGIVDLKTITDLDEFGEQFEKFNYGLQFAFYQAVAEQVLGKCLPFYAIVVEKAPTHRVGVFTVNQHRLERERRVVEYQIGCYADSLARNDWPTGYESIRTIGGDA